MKKAIIFDLDNTIYPAPSIGDKLFAPLYQLIQKSNEHSSHYDAIRKDMLSKPFQVVAANHGFSENLTRQGIDLLSNTTYDGPIQYYPDYEVARSMLVDKYLVTTGFLQLQQSKIEGLNIRADFKEIHIVDPATTSITKRDVFAGIIERNNLRVVEVLVVGDDLHSEIKAAQDLGIDAVMYDKQNAHAPDLSIPVITDFNQLAHWL